MNGFGQESPMQAAVAPVPSPSAGPSRQPLPVWDRRTWLVVIPLALTVIYAFIPVLGNGFVLWDDDQNFLTNHYFRGLGAAQVKWAWTTFWLGVYQPLAWLLFEAQYVFCQLDPRGYHLTSLLFQVADAVVLYVLTVALLVRCRTDSCLESPWTCSLSAGLATALFAVHPLRVETVAWVSCQPYLPCILLSMLAVLAYLRAFPMDSSPRRGWLAASFFLFVAALLFHAQPVTLPAVLLILDVYPLRRIGDGTGQWWGTSARGVFLEKVPFVMVSLVFMGLAIAAKPQSRFPLGHYDASEGIAQACYGTWFYIAKTVLPRNLIAVYPMSRELNWLAPRFSLSILATLAISAGLFLVRRRWPGLLAAWLSYLVILAPNSGIIRINAQIAADRYSYMSMLGSVMLVATGFCWVWRMSSRWRPDAAIGMIATGLAALLGLTALTRNQCRTWLDSETLWSHALTNGASFSFVAHGNLGVALQTNGRYQEAADHYTEALRLNPEYAKGHDDLGSVLYIQGKYEEAEAQFVEAVRLDPGDENAHNNLGFFLYTRGRYGEAWLISSKRCGSIPAMTKHTTIWAISSMRRGKREEAEAQFTEALRLNPEYADAHYNLGVALQTKGSYRAAKDHFTDVLRLNPGYADAHNNLGAILSIEGRRAEAEAHFAEAVRLDSGSVQAHYNLGTILSDLGNYAAARAHFAEAVRLAPGDPNVCNANAMLMAACPEAKFRDGKGAVQFATRACELTAWNDPLSLNALAAAQAEAGDFDAAVSAQKEGNRTCGGRAAETRLSFPARALPGQKSLPSGIYPRRAPRLKRAHDVGLDR